MRNKGFRSTRGHRIWVAIGFLCCALIALAGLVQVVHTHPGGRADRSDCALCHATHVVAEPAVAQLLPHTADFVAAVGTTPQTIHRKRLLVLSLYTRPPPGPAVA